VVREEGKTTMSLGQIVRQRREQRDLTQDQAALQIGISKPYLSNIETGKAKNPPSDAVLTALEKALGFPPGQLRRLAHLARTPIDVRHEHELLEAEVQKLRSVVKELLEEVPKNWTGRANLDALVGSKQGQDNVQQMPAGVVVPIINKVAAGYPHHVTHLDYFPSVADEYIRCPDLHDPQAFAARVVGDSMEPKYHEGDIVVFSPARPANDGEDCFVRFENDSATTFKRFYLDGSDRIRLQPLNNRYAAERYRREQITGLWPAVYRIERLGKS